MNLPYSQFDFVVNMGPTVTWYDGFGFIIRTCAIPVTVIGTPCNVLTFVVVTIKVRRFREILLATI